MPLGRDDVCERCSGRTFGVLKWARKHHCPWNFVTCMRAAEWASLEVLRWAMEHGAPIHHTQLQWYEHLLRGEPHAMDHMRRI